MRTWFTKLTANASLSVGNPELYGIACAAQFAFETARANNWGLDPDDVAQDVAEHVWRKLRAGGTFGLDGRTRLYVRTAVGWAAKSQWRKAKRARAWAQAQQEVHAVLVPESLSPGVSRLLGTLSAENRALLVRVAIEEEPLMDIGEARARQEAEAVEVEWDELPPSAQSKRTYKAYYTVHKRFSRMCEALRPKLA